QQQLDPGAGAGDLGRHAGSDHQGVGASDLLEVDGRPARGLVPAGVAGTGGGVGIGGAVADDLGPGARHQVEHGGGGHAAHHAGTGPGGAGRSQDGGAGEGAAAGGDGHDAAGVLGGIAP